MAPSAVETITVPEVQPKTQYKLSLGNYKDIDTTDIDKDVEEGRNGHQGAKVIICPLLLLQQQQQTLRPAPPDQLLTIVS